MKRIVIGLIAGCVFVAAAMYSNATVEAAESYTVITVRSAVEGEEVTFKGVYFSTEAGTYFGTDEGVSEPVGPRQIPFEMRVESEQFVALFRKLDGEPDLDVHLSRVEGSRALRSGAGATGTV